MPPKTSSMYPSSISRALCSDGMRCIKPLAPSRNETNSSRVNGGADGAILGICSYGGRDQETSRIHLATLRTRFAAQWAPAPPEQERTGGVPGVSARHRPRQKSGRVRDQSKSAVSRHRSERGRPRLPSESFLNGSRLNFCRRGTVSRTATIGGEHAKVRDN